MRLKWVSTALLVVTIGIPGSAQVSVYVEIAPPPIRYEQIEPAPSPDYCCDHDRRHGHDHGDHDDR